MLLMQASALLSGAASIGSVPVDDTGITSGTAGPNSGGSMFASAPGAASLRSGAAAAPAGSRPGGATAQAIPGVIWATYTCGGLLCTVGPVCMLLQVQGEHAGHCAFITSMSLCVFVCVLRTPCRWHPDQPRTRPAVQQHWGLCVRPGTYSTQCKWG